MNAFVGFRQLLEVDARQSRRIIAPWVGIVTVLTASSMIGYAIVFDDPVFRRTFSATIGTNPAFSLLFGPPSDFATADAFNVWRALGLGSFFTSLMAILVVTANSRAGEDSGQAELVASGVVGRQARLAAAVGLAWIASLMVGVVSGAVTLLLGGDLVATLLTSAAFTASGMVFGAVAAVTAQIGSFSQTANSLAVSLLGVCYLARGFATASPDEDWLLWFTPLGWTQKVAPNSDNNPWPLLACLGLSLVLLLIAFVLAGRRDFGMGLLPPAPGPDRGRLVTSSAGLALRLQRGLMTSWAVAFVVLGTVFGLLSPSIGDLFANNPQVEIFLAVTGNTRADLVFGFLHTLLQILAIIAAVFGIQVLMKFLTEETEYRAEPVLAAAVSRPQLMASHVVIALAGPALVLVLGGLVLALTAQATGTEVSVHDLVLQSVVEVPALWILVGVGMVVVGVHPAARLAAWVGVVATFGLTILGPSLNLPGWLLDVSPLRHVPNVTAEAVDWWPLGWLCGIALVLGLVGFVGFRRRDLLYEQP
ncbi:exporter of polyketide antibiotics [Microlunatus panaciterrae]|uniref:ABC-2 type transport system permease protein n=1 Tax=Microlunatus panaciterrae TaxID=400768 RepID=A0ABS2RJU3_9ACTN|nr:hypothetical protein [Microlunatus panaciterrae]MBM7799275.1 ABC-2 type transport system permease protein [Microlunatus panaciterrae]